MVNAHVNPVMEAPPVKLLFLVKMFAPKDVQDMVCVKLGSASASLALWVKIAPSNLTFNAPAVETVMETVNATLANAFAIQVGLGKRAIWLFHVPQVAPSMERASTVGAFAILAGPVVIALNRCYQIRFPLEMLRS
jgi:hypothetical protein